MKSKSDQIHQRLVAVLADPADIRAYSIPDAYEILQRMVQVGYYSECLQAIEELRSDLFDVFQIVSSRKQLNALLKIMRRDGLDLNVLRDVNLGNFCEIEIRAKLAKRDTLRAWELIRMSQRSEFENERLPTSLMKALVSELYELMISKRLLENVDLKQNPPPTRVNYAVRERSPAKFDRLGRRRKPRTYQLRGHAPGLVLAKKFVLPYQQGSTSFDETGLKILAIAAYFSEKKRGR